MERTKTVETNAEIMGKSVRQPIEATDLFSDMKGVKDPFFGNVTTRETTGKGIAAPKSEYVENATPFDNPRDIERANAASQPWGDLAWRTASQFRANFVSSVGQSLANTFDFISNAKTAQGLINGTDDDFDASFLGISTKDMQGWANGVAERNKIYEQQEGNFDLTDAGWWGKQIASAGTGVGMGVAALAETAAIEYATGGMGTGVALARLGNLIKNIGKAGKAAEKLREGFNAAKGLKSAATVYGVMSRVNESKMEASNTYDDILRTVANERNEDGSRKYTDQEAKHMASEGAKRDYAWNMALIPLDILSYRAMIFNPISGKGIGFIEKGLEKVAGAFGKTALGKGAGWVAGKSVGIAAEGIEEGFQFVGQEEGKHYAQVVGGQDDGSSFAQRFSKDVQADEFWNSFAGGVIGSPIIGGAMNLVNKITTGNRNKKIEAAHKYYVQNVGKMDGIMASRIKEYEEAGNTEAASVLRRQLGASKALAGLHLDASTDKETAFDSRMHFISATLGELKAGKTDALEDLGFFNVDATALPKIIEEFETYEKDAKNMKNIYDHVKNRYNKNLVPEIANDHFQLERLIGEQSKIDKIIGTERSKLSQYGMLSAQGKEVYDTEFQLRALLHENDRLTEEAALSENKHERENVRQLIKLNQGRIVATKARLGEINADETYTDDVKDIDADIFNSTLRSRDYQQAVYDKVHLDNAIALKRKDVALWNNQEYIDSKTTKAVVKAKTKEQVANNAVANPSPQVAEVIKEKEAEIEAEIAAEDIPDTRIGNSNLFPEDESMIDSIYDVVNPSNPEDELSLSATDRWAFEPAEYDFNKSSDESKAKIKNGVGGLLSKLGKDASFEDLVRHVAKVKGTDTADTIYNAVKYGWEANGKEPADYDTIYERIFGVHIDQLVDGASQLIISNSAEVIESVEASQNPPQGFDNNNQPIYKYVTREEGKKAYVTNESSPKGAFVTMASRLSTTEIDDTIEVVHDYTDRELNISEYVDSLPLLDPDKWDAGTQAEIRIPSNYNDILVPVYNSDGTKGKALTFGQWVAQETEKRGITLTEFQETQEYKDKIPMIIYRKGAPSTEKGVMFVHDIGWYHPLRFNQQKSDDMKEAISATREVREEVLNNNGEPVPTTITGKRQTTFEGLKLKTPITLRQANPQTELVVVNADLTSFRDNKTNVAFPTNGKKLMNVKPFQRSGQVAEIRRYGKDAEGVPTYMAFPVTRSRLSQEAIQSIIQAITIYATAESALTPQQRAVVEHIKATMGTDVDIRQAPKSTIPSGLKLYLQHFIRVFEPNGKKESNEDIEAAAAEDLAPGTPYIAFKNGGNVVFGQAGVVLFTDSQGKKVGSMYIGQGTSKSGISLAHLNDAITAPESKDKMGRTTRLGWFEQNLSLDAKAANKPIVHIDKNYTSSVVSPSYNDYLLDNLNTDIKSINIGTEEKPNYITNIQPVVTYDTNKRLAKSTKQPTNEEIKTEVVPDVVVPETVVTPTRSLEDIRKEAEAMLAKRLGNDRGLSRDVSDREVFEPAEIDLEGRRKIAQSIDRIAGLSPVQQNTVVNFIFNQITGLVNFETLAAKKEDIDREVERIFDKIMIAERNADLDTIAFNKNLLETFPSLRGERSSLEAGIRDLEARVALIDAIKDNFDLLKDLAYEKVKKNTGITQNKQVTEREEGEVTDGDENTDRQTDFWTDILTESPENKLSYAMRRFFGQTRKYDKNGEPMVGFMNLPLYEDASNIIRKLMTTLVEVPANFNDMLAKLKENVDSVPYMRDLIGRLEGATEQRKNQFVTVMHNTSLRMKMSMIGFDRKRKTWNVKLIDATLNGVAATVKGMWVNNLIGDNRFNLILLDEESNQKLNDVKAQKLIHTFERWVGIGIKELTVGMDALKSVAGDVKTTKPITAQFDKNRHPALVKELKENLKDKGDRMKFSISGRAYQIISLDNDKYQVSFLSRTGYKDNEELADWLREFGIILSPDTMKELMTIGMMHNYDMRKPRDLFETGKSNGLFGILYEKLKSAMSHGEDFDFTEFGDGLLDDTVIASLANLEAKHTDIQAIFGFRVNKKSYFALTAPSYVSDRATDLKDSGSSVREQLKQISFSQPSLWLTLLQDEDFRQRFSVVDDSAESLKQTGKRAYRAANLASLSDADHELSKISKFQFKVGEVRYGKDGLNKYPGTGIAMRMATMFGLTMSDKDRMKLITTAVLDLDGAHLQNGLHDEVIKALYEQTVKPELLRMIKHANITESGKTPTNVNAYDKGARIFMMIPEMNNIMYNPNLRLVDAIKNQPRKFTAQMIEGDVVIMKAINTALKEHVNNLVKDKLKVWEKNGYVSRDEQGEIEEIKFFDKKYMSKFKGTKEEQLIMAARDFEVNNLIANANNFMLFAGDPAMYFKSESTDYVQQAEDTFENINKRLANQVAPGTSVPGSKKNEKYLQIFLNDRKATASNIEYLERILGVEGAKGYRDIKIADAQEYTTWKEHLDILNRLGKSADYMFDITPEEIQETRELMNSGLAKKDLTAKQMQLILKVMQPIKPVYTGQLYDKDQDLMRTVYIKSSSFPLIPQLTSGLEIDKLRKRMEQIQDRMELNVRASYQSGNKVGALTVPSDIQLWSENGTMNEATLKDLTKYMLPLDRKNFRIQQEVPFKSDKSDTDLITLGTQLMKILFGDDMMNQTGFMLDGKEYTGRALHQKYTDAFTALIKEKQTQLFDELGLDSDGVPINPVASMTKLQDLLMREAKKRGYPLQDIKALEIDPRTGNFNLPLWASTNSNRYESMLNAIVSKRMIAMKFPGASFVTGSEEGFKTKVEGELSNVEKLGIIHTSAWTGELKANQVFLPSKFRGHDGKLLDLFVKENGKFKYVVETPNGFKLNEDMFDKELLQNLTFRIPTSGHQSGSLIEIAGFLPHTSGDLIIVSRNSIVQKGLDFDVDKENAYQLWTHLTKEGKFEVLSEKHRKPLQDEAVKLANDIKARKAEIKASKAKNYEEYTAAKQEQFYYQELSAEMDSTLNAFFGDDATYTEEEINEEYLLRKANSKISEKLFQNEIIKIKRSVYANPSDAVQTKITKTLNTKYVEEQAILIEGLINQSKPSRSFSPLSSEHQKLTLISGVGGTIGKGAYSLDVTFHSLAQQSNISGNPIILNSVTSDEENDKIVDVKRWAFGDVESKGILGQANTIDGGRSISEVVSERQNISVDNSTLQIMGRVNLNQHTFDVDKVFILLGIDKGSDGNSIPLLFLSQPIIRDFVDEMKNANSIFAEFEVDKEQKIVDRLLTRYDADTKAEDITSGYWEMMSKEMSNPNLITALSTPTPNGKLQGTVLRRFIEMKQYGLAIRGIQGTVNFSNNGFGKSFFDVVDKKEAINRLGAPAVIKVGGVEIGNIVGQEGLIGEYISKDISPNNTTDGYVDIGNYWVKPNTVAGAFSINATMTAYNLWSKYFPYDTDISQAVFKEITGIITNTDLVGGSKMVETKQDIFQNIKRYLASSKMNGIIRSTDDINEERRRLYIDSEENTSLAKYMKILVQMNDPVVREFIKTNKLINRFEYDLKKDGTPSRIRYSNAAGEEFDEQYLYESLSSLLEPQGKDGKIQLPTIGNKSYTLDSLAQDLIAYSFLGNAVQEAIQFTKYVPVAYLNVTGYSNWLRNNADSLGIKMGEKMKGQEHLVSEFTMQYIQHNPEAVKFRLSDDKNNSNYFLNKIIENDSSDLSKLNKFKLKSKERPIFINIYNPTLPKGDNKNQLYWASDGETYTRVPVLGVFGMDEYQPGDAGTNTIGQSIVHGRIKIKAKPQNAINKVAEDPSDVFDVKSGNLGHILENIEKSQIAGMAELARAIRPFIANTKISYADFTGRTRGRYNGDDDAITINPVVAAELDMTGRARTILHETVHALTFNQIDKYITRFKDGSVQVQNNAPVYVTELVRLYNDVRSKQDTDALKKVMQKLERKEGITDEERNTMYGFTNIHEFIAMALTPNEFQNYLAKEEFKQSGKTLLERFQEIIASILKSLGVQFESDTAAAHAIGSIFTLIKEENEVKDTGENMMFSSDEFYEDALDDFDSSKYQSLEDKNNQDFLDRLDNFDEDMNEFKKGDIVQIRPEFQKDKDDEGDWTILKVEDKGEEARRANLEGFVHITKNGSSSVEIHKRELKRKDSEAFEAADFPNKSLDIRDEKCN